MSVILSDPELLARLKEIGAEYNYSPEAVLELGKAAIQFQRDAVIPNFPPFPQEIDECEISEDVAECWPDWVAVLIPSGSKWERLHWPDGSQTIRLVDPRGAVLAATKIHTDRTPL